MSEELGRLAEAWFEPLRPTELSVVTTFEYQILEAQTPPIPSRDLEQRLGETPWASRAAAVKPDR
jgi:hypothetical protein